VGIVGGGDVAIDASRTAWRLGASEVHLIYRRNREQMPAHKEEVQAAEEEGTRFHFLTNPTRILGDGPVSGVECLKHVLGQFDRSGRRRPVPVEGSEHVLDLDVLIPAIGQEPDIQCFDPDADSCEACGIGFNRNSTFIVNRALATTRPGIFAAGDVVLGPATVIQAVAQGNEVARSVDHYLRSGSDDVRLEKQVVLPGYEAVEQIYDLADYADAKRPESVELSVEERKGNFKEVELGLSEETIREECRRCLRCDLEWLEMKGLPREPQPDRPVKS
jgi:NADPH-dependent glutamate synthase beta subunit-like oxidoreductase